MHSNNTAISKDTQSRMYSSKLQSMIWQIVRTLSQIDADFNLRGNEVECSVADEELKAETKRKLRAAHRGRREPYVKQLEELQKRQQRQPFAH
jgi:hypothetical protein